MKIGPRLLAVFLCAFSLATQAEHHRMHIIEAIDGDADFPFSIQLFVDGSVGNLNFYEANVTLISNQHINRIASVRAALTRVGNHSAQIKDALLNDTMTLDQIRALINQPRSDVKPPGGHSLMWHVNRAQYNIRHLIGINPLFDPWLTATQGNLSTISDKLGEMNWHIVDAIREEIYLDPDFQ